MEFSLDLTQTHITFIFNGLNRNLRFVHIVDVNLIKEKAETVL